jgi:hypothetical protein
MAVNARSSEKPRDDQPFLRAALTPNQGSQHPFHSTVGQTLDSQLEQLRQAGCRSRNIYREKATGARPDRRELNRKLGRFQPARPEVLC